MTATTEIQMVPVDAITVLNPQVRNRRVFHELITSIAHLGLKKPITVSRRGTEPGMTWFVDKDGWRRLSRWDKARSRRLSSKRRKRTAM